MSIYIHVFTLDCEDQETPMPYDIVYEDEQAAIAAGREIKKQYGYNVFVNYGESKNTITGDIYGDILYSLPIA